MKPLHIYRKNDGFRFTLQSYGLYTMDDSIMDPKYQYHVDCFNNSDFVTDKNDVEIKEYKCRNDGHGNDE